MEANFSLPSQIHMTEGAPVVRPAEVRDLSSIAKLYNRVWHETHGPRMPRAERESRDETFFLNRMTNLMPNILVCEDERGIVGFAAWKGSCLGQLFLDASARGSGLAYGLMEAAEREMRDQAVADAELYCLVGNERAKRFYERAGWHVSGITAGAVRSDTGDGQRDFWVIRKRLHSAPVRHPSRE